MEKLLFIDKIIDRDWELLPYTILVLYSCLLYVSVMISKNVSIQTFFEITTETYNKHEYNINII